MRRKNYAYDIHYPLPIYKKGGYLDMYLQQMYAGGVMQPVDTSNVKLPFQTTAPQGYASTAGAASTSMQQSKPTSGFNYSNAAVGALSGLANGYAKTGTVGGAVSGLVDTAVKSIPVAGQIISAVDAVADPIATAFGNAGTTNQYNQAAERLVNPLNSLESGISNLIDGNSREGWNDLAGVVLPGYAGYNDAKWEREKKAAYERSMIPVRNQQTKQREVSSGYSGKYWDQNQMIAAYGGSLPVIGESYAQGGYIDRYGATRADLPQISNYNSGISTLEDGGKLPQVTTYNEGGTHQENINGGVPVDSQGNKTIVNNARPVASVEEGELAWFNPSTKQSYVFSNKIFVK